MEEKIAVVGLGYVGLPVALACARHFHSVVGFDVDQQKIKALIDGTDKTGEVPLDVLRTTSLLFTADPEQLAGATFFIVAVPTPVDIDNRPDFSALRSACALVGPALSRGAVVVFESTVYPGVTEDLCGPWLEKASGLKRGADFTVGYSPERINPGDKEHSLERITKIISAEDSVTLHRVAAVYGTFVEAGLHEAPSIKVAEAAKVIENTQRDLNIALMNELALIFDRIGIATRDVLAAAGTKWNFLPFKPGLVGGHCIGVDPYYLTTKAEQLGYQPEVILAGRRINNGMGAFIAQKLVKFLVANDVVLKKARVGILGLTFKENVSDLRNSRIPDIVNELKQFGVAALVHDPLVRREEAIREYKLVLSPWEDFRQLDALILAVPHAAFLSRADLLSPLIDGGVLIDVKAVIDQPPKRVQYWSL